MGQDTARVMHRRRTRIAVWPKCQDRLVEVLAHRGAVGLALICPAGAEAGEGVLEQVGANVHLLVTHGMESNVAITTQILQLCMP